MFMAFLGNVLLALATVVDMLLNIYTWVLIISVLISWVNPDPYNPIVRVLRQLTDPVLNWVRRRVPLAFGGFDLTPIVVILVLKFFQIVLVNQLIDISMMLRSGN